MNIEFFGILLRTILIFFTAMTSQVAFRKRFTVLGIFLFSVWFTFFRLTLLRATAFYIGVFQKENPPFVNNLISFLQRADVAIIESILIIISLYFLLRWLMRQKGRTL